MKTVPKGEQCQHQVRTHGYWEPVKCSRRGTGVKVRVEVPPSDSIVRSIRLCSIHLRQFERRGFGTLVQERNYPHKNEWVRISQVEEENQL